MIADRRPDLEYEQGISYVHSTSRAVISTISALVNSLGHPLKGFMPVQIQEQILNARSGAQHYFRLFHYRDHQLSISVQIQAAEVLDQSLST